MDQQPQPLQERAIRFYTESHQHYCGIDLHAKTMYLCILDREGQVLLHRNIKSRPETFLEAVAPYRDGLVVAAECIFTWYWLADLCRREGIPFVLGHALYMKAIHGAKAKNDRVDAFKIASLLRGGNLPMAYVYPPEMRATRDLLRRRLHLVRRRGNLLAHVQNTHHQYNLPVPAAKVAHAANRTGAAEVFADPDVRRSIEVDLAMVGYYDTAIRELELHLVRRAKEHDPQATHRLRSVPGIGKILALTILYGIHDIGRFPRVQDFLSYSRLVRCEHSSAGKRLGTGGAKIGNVHLKWAFSEAAVLFLRKNPEGQKHLRRLAGRHGKAKALSILAAKLGRTVYTLLAKERVFDMERFLAGTM